MINMLTVQKLGPKLIEALGAPGHCTWIELRLAFDEIPTVRCEYYPVGDDGTIDHLGKVLAEYELVPRQGAPAALVPTPHPAEMVGFAAWQRNRIEVAHAAMMAEARKGGVAYAGSLPTDWALLELHRATAPWLQVETGEG